MFCELAVPAAEHSAHFVDFYRQGEVFFVIQRFGLPQDHKQYFHRIDFANRNSYIRLFFFGGKETGDSDGFDRFNAERVNTLS